MSVTESHFESNASVVTRFSKYLNGPLGRLVLENLSEGESFILQTSYLTLQVTKKKGRAEVEVLDTSNS